MPYEDIPTVEPIPLPSSNVAIDSLWNYHNDGLSQSFLKKFRECKLQTRLEYVDGWTKEWDSTWFRYGHLIHHLLHMGFEKAPMTSENEVLQESKSYAETHWYGENTSDKYMDECNILISLAAHVIPWYFKLAIIDTHTTTTLDCEKEYRMPMGDTFLRGILDRVYKTQEGELVVRDYKTTSRKLNAEEFRGEYKLDTQTYLYLALAASKWGEVPKRMEYAFIRTPANSYSRRKSGFVSGEFINKINKEMDSSLSNWLLTIELEVSAEELLHWKRTQLEPMVAEVKQWWESKCPGQPYNEQSLRTKFNSKCQMYDMIVHGSTDGYYKREKAFSEYSV